MMKTRLIALGIFILGAFLVFSMYYGTVTKENAPSWATKAPFKLGLDLSGGSHLVYGADVGAAEVGNVKDAMSTLRDVIERRINAFGVAEPNIQVQEASFTKEEFKNRLIIDLPEVTDINEAIKIIGQTPLLEFRTEKDVSEGELALLEQAQSDYEQAISDYQARIDNGADPETLPLPEPDPILLGDFWNPTDLSGGDLERALIEFIPIQPGSAQNGIGGEPYVSLQFNRAGADKFELLTEQNVGKRIAIFLDGNLISSPVVQQKISGGTAQITGSFGIAEAKELANRLNAGALPVPVTLLSTQIIGPSLGAQAVAGGIKAAEVGFLLIGIFLILYYRLPGLIGVVALTIYVAIVLFLFKIIPVTITAAGIAGFIVSIGMAVDANILIFERMKEELRRGLPASDAVKIGFSRAWTSIRDANISSIISAAVLFWFGTALIKGFALTFGIGVLISMFSAVTITRYLLLALTRDTGSKFGRFIMNSGLGK